MVNIAKPSQRSLSHEQQRRIELKCIELEAMLEEQGMTQEEINEKVQELRNTLTEGEISRQMSQIDVERSAIVSETPAEVQKKEDISEAMGTSEVIGSSNSSNKTSPRNSVDLIENVAADTTPSKSKKRKRKSRDSSLSSERRKKYSKKSKKRSSSETRDKSHKKAKKDKHGGKKSSYKKDLKQKKGSDSDTWKKKSKKRSSRKRRRSREDGKSKEVGSPSLWVDEKSNGEGRKKKKRSKERRELRKSKRGQHRGKEKLRRKRSRSDRRRSNSSHKRSSSTSSASCTEIGTKGAVHIAKQNSLSPKTISNNESIEKNIINVDNRILDEEIHILKGGDLAAMNNVNHVVPLNIIKVNYSSENDNTDDIFEKNVDKTEIPLPSEDGVAQIAERSKFGMRMEFAKKNIKERVPEIAPFRIEPKNNLLRPLEKLARPFSSPFRKMTIDGSANSKSLSFVPKLIEKEAEPLTEAPKPVNKTMPNQLIVIPDEDAKTPEITEKVAPALQDEPERKIQDSKGIEQWSSSASSSSRSSRAGSVCSTCSSDGSGKYDSRYGKRRYNSGSPSSRSSSSSHRSRSRSPSIPRRRGSPSFLERRRITSARKRPIPYHRSSPMSSSSESRRYSDNGYSSSDNDDSRSSSYSARSWSRSRSRSASPDYSCYP